jgi:Flp pilus assembly protein TadG
MMIRLLQTVRSGRFVRDRRGVSAVEFALIAPVMIGLYLGCNEIAQGINIDRKVTLTAGTTANLAAQVSSISSDDMDNIMNASQAILAPYSTAPLKIVLSCLNIDANKKVTVKWSKAQNADPRGTGTSVTIPSGLLVADTQLLYSEVSYTYTPTIGYVITGSLNLSDTMFMSPRISAPSYDSTACSS